ncbi:t-SNARE affecting a late Golgi compartment protein 1 [Trichomonascus vanleenenianus]|uniref:Tlg1p n=1 Tax=Trichomonascus vanleenenianus TaxID=2268995 RepID=UPI003ECA85BF
MDPFSQVYEDAQNQLSNTHQLLERYQRTPTEHHLLDLNNATQELIETIHDLSQSIGAVQSQPGQFGLNEHEIGDRIAKVALLNNRLSDIQETVGRVKKTHPSTATWNDDSTGNIAETGEGQMSNLLYQDIIEEQDQVLDSVYSTVNNLREQADYMSRELEDQSYLIEDFDRQVDTAGDKLRRGLKRVNWIVENQETLSSCCITMLIVALIVLLILLLVL